MSISTGTTDIMGGGAGYGFGGFGGIAPIGIIGLNTLFGRGGFGHDGFDGRNGSFPGTTVLEQNVSELRKDVQGVNTEVHKLGNEVAGMFAQQNLAFTGEFRNLDNQICNVEKTLLNQSYAQSLQAFQNTQAIQTQLNNFQHATDQQFCAVKSQINADGDITRALINSLEVQNLRDQLHSERRGRDNREIEINVSQNVNQMQQQQQAQFNHLASIMNEFGQNLRATQSVVNFGNGNARANQQSTNNQVG